MRLRFADLAILAPVAGCLVVGCGGSVGAGTDDAGADGALDTSAPSSCPAALPLDNTPCPRVDLVCEYGDDPRAGCNDSVECLSPRGWTSRPRKSCPPLVPPGATCPPSADAAKAMSAECSTEGLVCVYGDRFCVCSACNGLCSTTRRWSCDEPPKDTRCPSKRPTLGATCTVEGTSCTYGVCAASATSARKCVFGVWIDEPVACPA